MYKQEFIIDTDSLIKLTKSGIIKEACRHFKFAITEEVYDEAVTKGKIALHKDAFEIEELINKNLIKIRGKKEEETLETMNLGKGETSTFALYKIAKGVIVTDDNTFINFLKNNKTEFMVPADFLVLMRNLKKINSAEALSYLENIKPHIKPKVYLNIKKVLEG